MDPPPIHFSPHEPPKRPYRGLYAIGGIIGVFFALAILAVAGLLSWAGTGKTNLTIEFLITDEVTGMPIPQATINVTGYTSFQRSEREEFQFITTASGQAFSKPIPVMTDEGQRLWRSWSYANPPDWAYHISAEGYETTEPQSIWECPQRKTGSQSHVLTVSVAMKRK